MIVDRFQYRRQGTEVYLQLNLANKVEKIKISTKEQRYQAACTLISKRIKALIEQRKYAFSHGKIKFRSSWDSNLYSKAFNNLEAQLSGKLTWDNLGTKARILNRHLKVISGNTSAWNDLLEELDDLIAHPEQLKRNKHESNT